MRSRHPVNKTPNDSSPRNTVPSIHDLHDIETIEQESLDDAISAILEELEKLEPDMQDFPISKSELDGFKKHFAYSLNQSVKAEYPQSSIIQPRAHQNKAQSIPTILILTSEGGAGHKEAASDSERYFAEQVKMKKIKINKVFVLPEPNSHTKSWMRLFGIDFGKQGVRDWNTAQKNGDMEKVKSMVAMQWMSEMLFGGKFSTNTFLELTQNQNTTQVIDTQAINSHKIVKSVAEFNRIRSNQERCERYNKLVRFNNILRKIPVLSFLAIDKYRHEIQYAPNNPPIKIKKRMTDLPNKAEHFFQSLNKISAKDLPYFELEVPHAPLLRTDAIHMSIEERRLIDFEYYRTKCPNLFTADGNPLADFTFTDGPIKKEFLHYKDHPVDKSKDLSLNMKVANPNEVSMLKESGAIDADASVSSTQTIHVTIPADAKVQSIMLGSQAAVEATLEYVDTEIAACQQNSDNNQEQYIFVFCGKHDASDSLFAQLNEKIRQGKSTGQIPKNLKIIPLTYQDANLIAPLYSRSDEVFIRAGGISCMEIEAVSQGKVNIHSERKGQQLTQAELLAAMLFWEQGNAEHVMQVLGLDGKGQQLVQVTNPETYRMLKLNRNHLKEMDLSPNKRNRLQ